MSRQVCVRWAGTFIMATMLAGCGEAPDDPRAKPPLVRTAEARAAGTSEREFSGVVGARVQSDLGFRIDGKITARLVDAGQSVRRGQPLMRIDPTDYRLAADAAAGTVDAARARAIQTTADETRYRDLVDSPIMEEKFDADRGHGFGKTTQFIGSILPFVDRLPDLFVEAVEAVAADRLADRLLRFEKAIDIGFREADLARKVGHGRLGIAIMGKMFVRRGDDLFAHHMVGRPTGGRAVAGWVFAHPIPIAMSSGVDKL